MAAAAASGHCARDGGTYGHVDGPRFNTPSEIAQLAGCGVTAVSQTAGPETVLCGELELPVRADRLRDRLRQRGHTGRDHAGGELIELMGRSSAVFADVLAVAVARLERAAGQTRAGTVYRFEQS